MSDLSLNHDLYHESHSRRRRETEAWSRDRALRREARSARARVAPAPSRRTRLVAVLSPLVVIGTLVGAGIIG